MTSPTPPDRWAAFRAAVGQWAARLRAGVNPLTVAMVAFAVLLVIALIVAINAVTTPVHREGRPTASVTPLPAPTTAAPISTPTPSASGSATPSAELPAGPTPTAPTMKSSGKFDTAGVNVPASSSSGTLHRYSVRVETTTKLNADKTARQIAGVLNDPRSWAGSGAVRFALVADPAKADFTITLAAPGTATKLCSPEPDSCVDSGDVVIDASRWLSQSAEFATLGQWQAFLLNHATGHLLGERHKDCATKGKLAPVMMPQGSGLGGCTSNPWPFP